MNARTVIGIALFGICASIAILVFERISFRHVPADSVAQFQRFTCGLGLGAAVNPRWGFTGFDPRIDAIDESGIWPVPGGYSYAPTVTGSVSDFRENHL